MLRNNGSSALSQPRRAGIFHFLYNVRHGLEKVSENVKSAVCDSWRLILCEHVNSVEMNSIDGLITLS